ncbi:hypothetical protein [Desulfoplanes sp.]
MKRLYAKCTVIFMLVALATASVSWAGAEDSNTDPVRLDHALQTMFDQVGPTPPPFVGGKDVDLLIDIVRSSTSGTELELPDRKRMSSAYYPFDVRISLQRLLEFGYNPDLPTYLVAPNTVRKGQWTLVDGQEQPLPRLWTRLGNLGDPVVVRGVEHEEITPDIFSGGYYSYDMDRALILLAREGAPVLISVTNQQKESDVGKKGAVVGKDSQWNYLYSGVDGLTKGGLGWVDSYMYAAMSVTVFCQVRTPQGPVLKAGVFKWIRAGWAGINMVRTHHIKDGCRRFASAMKEILETPGLPDKDRVAEHVDVCRNLTPGELRELVGPYIEYIKETNDPVVEKNPFKSQLDSGEYLATMPKEDMVKVLVQGYLKEILGRKSVIDTASCERLLRKRTASAK